MATALQIISRALRTIRVIDAHTPASDEEAADAFEALNDMLAEWHEAGIGLPDYSVANYTTELASDASDVQAVTLSLAERLAPEYGRDLPPPAQRVLQEAMQRLRLRYFEPGEVSFAELPGEGSTYNITTDE